MSAMPDAPHAHRSVVSPKKRPVVSPVSAPAAAAAAPLPSPAKPIRMLTDPRPAKPVRPPDDDDRTETAAEQRAPTQGSPATDTAAVVKDMTAVVSGAGKASLKGGGGIGRHRLPEAEPKLEEAKVPRSKACCGGCSIM